METLHDNVRNNVEIIITLTNASKEYLFYIHDILCEMQREDKGIFQFNVVKPIKDDVLDIEVRAFGCSNRFKNYLYLVFNKLYLSDRKTFNYQTTKSDSYIYSSEEITKANLAKCDEIMDYKPDSNTSC